jgi:tubulin alpha
MVFSNRETVSIHLGQAGCQLASTTWELYCLEHGIRSDGTIMDCAVNDDNCFNTFFCESQTGRYVPRAIMVDTEPTVSLNCFLM